MLNQGNVPDFWSGPQSSECNCFAIQGQQCHRLATLKTEIMPSRSLRNLPFPSIRGHLRCAANQPRSAIVG
jgi:hypothetical protein